MKKYFISFLILSVLPGLSLGASARYTQLVREKQAKMEQLEKCMGSTKGLKIAGVSTLGLTAAGVAANIYEAKTIKTNEKTIEKNEKKIKTAQEEVDDLTAKKAKREADAKLLADCKKQLAGEKTNADKITSVEIGEDGNCKILACEDGFDGSNGTSCMPKPSETTTADKTVETANFQTLCVSEKFNGEYNPDTISKDEYTFQGNTITAGATILEVCVLSGNVNTEGNCIELAKKCVKPRRYHYDNSGVCACLDELKAKCNNGKENCRDGDTNEAKGENLPKTDTNLAEKCTKDFAGVDEAYRTLDGAEFCTLHDWDSKETVSAKCSELGLNLCELKPDCTDDDATCKEYNPSYWVCSTDCSVIPTDYNERPDWLRPGNL